MIQNLFVLILSFAGLSTAKSFNPTIPTALNLNTTSTSCGQLFSLAEGGISYKPFGGTVENNERCIWIISAPNATTYKVDILYLGYSTNNSQESEIGLNILGLKLCGTFEQWSPDSISSKTFSKGDDNEFGCDMSTLVITFYSGPNAKTLNQNGFILKYDVTEFGHALNTRHISSKDYLITPDIKGVRHPVTLEERYHSQQLSTFAFLPENNILTERSQLNVIFSRLGFKNESGKHVCNDSIKVFFLNVNNYCQNKWKWQEKQTICGDTEVYQINHTDLMLLSFNAKSMGFTGPNAKGFHLINVSTNCNCCKY